MSSYADAVELAGKINSDDDIVYTQAIGVLRDLIHALRDFVEITEGTGAVKMAAISALKQLSLR